MRSLLVSLVGVAVLVGCSPGQGESPSASPGVPSLSPSMSPGPSASSSATPSPTAVASYPDSLPTDDPEKAAVIAGWQEYWRVYEKFAADPSLTDLTETQYVTTGEEAKEILDLIASLRHEGVRSEGGRKFSDVEVSIAGGFPMTAIIKYCMNVDELLLFDIATGERIPRSGAYVEEARLENKKDGTWRVSYVKNEPAQC